MVLRLPGGRLDGADGGLALLPPLDVLRLVVKALFTVGGDGESGGPKELADSQPKASSLNRSTPRSRPERNT